MTGKRLGHFEIQAKIGEGGMGAVYRAKDLALGRSVALKVLPPEMIAVPERKARFIQEAKAASSLQHPNIVTIHEIGTQDGVDFIAMELVEGKTLAELIPRGKGMNPAEALRIARQLADGLAKAHGARIVHRDLKPANIMVSTDGHAKILDFGLAKLQPDPIPEGSSTVTNVRTETGTIMGTFAYMSPEQAEGRKLDARSDIFSFGAVLYEMLSGRRAFERDTNSGTLAAVMRDTPDMSGVPASLAGIVSRCLQKNQDHRYQSMADVRAAVLDLNQKPQSAVTPWLAPALATAAVAAAVIWWWQQPQDHLPPMRVVPLTTDAGSERWPTFSPDGTQVAYAWDGGQPGGQNYQLYVKVIGSPTALQLTTNAGSSSVPSWSPDGRQIAFAAVRNGKPGVYMISPLGGQERRLMEGEFRQICWTPDSRNLVVANGDIFLAPVEGGEPRVLLAKTAAEWYLSADIDSTGRSVAYWACGVIGCRIRASRLDGKFGIGGGESVPGPLLGAGSLTALRWANAGRTLVWSATAGLAFSGYIWQGAPGSAEPQRLEVAGVMASEPALALRGDRLAFSRSVVNLDVWAMDERGDSRPLISSSLSDNAARYSPDGSKIAFVTPRGGETTQIWLANADGSGQTQLTNGPHSKGSPAWSPDGKWVTYDEASGATTGIWQVWLIESAGGTPRRLTNLPASAVRPFWSRDGHYIYFGSGEPRSNLYRVPAQGGTPEQLTTNGGLLAQESFDGKTLYYTAQLAPGKLMAQPLGGKGAATIVLESVTTTGFHMVTDGVYYVRQTNLGKGEREIRFRDFRTRNDRLIGMVRGFIGPYLSVSPDRKTILFSHSPQSGSDLMLIENFR